MNIFIVNQNPISRYNDEEGKRYDYPLGIANGQQIQIGDLLIFNLSLKNSKNIIFDGKRLIGVAKIDELTYYSSNGKDMAIATYEWYKKFINPISFEEIGGDPRSNLRNSINKVPITQQAHILYKIISFL